MKSKIKSWLLLSVVGAVMILAFQNFSFTENRFYKFVPIQGEDWPEPSDTDENADGESGGYGGGYGGAYGSGSAGASGLPNIRTTESGGIDPSAFKDMISFGQ